MAAQGHRLGIGLVKLALQPLRSAEADFGVEHHIEVGVRQLVDVAHAGMERRHHGHVDAELVEQLGDFFHIVAVAKP